MEPILLSLRAVLRGALVLGLSLTVFAQIPAAPDASGFPFERSITIGSKDLDVKIDEQEHAYERN